MLSLRVAEHSMPLNGLKFDVRTDTYSSFSKIKICKNLSRFSNVICEAVNQTLLVTEAFITITVQWWVWDFSEWGPIAKGR